ncbi:MAG: PhzF family phenazine biosynthesis protein [Acidimicrobiales bacterium]
MLAVTQIDAFTARPFAGNPAAVCVLDSLHDDAWMQATASEMALSETAFLAAGPDGWHLRWFTPTVEVDLCGHATLASAHHLYEAGLADPGGAPIRFQTRSGILTAERDADGWISLDLPATVPEPATPPDALLEALGVEGVVATARAGRDWLIELPCPEAVRDLTPDATRLRQVPEVRGMIVTSVGDGLFDIVSRFFAPGSGIDEDPVTGSAHAALGPWWSPRLDRAELLASQASSRGGVVRVAVDGDRVRVAGQAVTTLRGQLLVGPAPVR